MYLYDPKVGTHLICMCHFLEEAIIMATSSMGYVEHSKDVDDCMDG